MKQHKVEESRVDSKLQSAAETDEATQQSLDSEQEVLTEAEQSDSDAELQKLRLELDEYKNLFLRKAAEFENFKKRTQQEFSALISSAEAALITDILPVLDDFDRLLANSEAGQENLISGAKLIRDKLMDILAARGLKPIEAVGTPFDPELHEALLQQQDDSAEPGMVLHEHLRGYRLGDKVIRHSQVVVSG